MSPAPRLGPTDPSLLDPASRPYFLWWTDMTVGDLKRCLSTGSAEERAYWIGALLREANSRDVWLFVTPTEVRAAWPTLVRFLGRSRAMWAWLLGVPELAWPPAEASIEPGILPRRTFRLRCRRTRGSTRPFSRGCLASFRLTRSR